jgi:hypothetical protein
MQTHTDMDRPKKCSSLILENKEHLKMDLRETELEDVD